MAIAEPPKERRERPRDERARRGALDGLLADIQVGIYNLAYVAVLADSGLRAALGVNLSPDALPEPDPAEGLPVSTREEWQAELFPDGQMRVPSPADGDRWTLFVEWASEVNPALWLEVEALARPALNTMNDIRLR